MTKLRILIADDHAVVRAGVRSILEEQPDFEVCGEATTGRQAVTLAEQLKPDIIVLDITMPELNGLEVTRQILKIMPDAQVLILSVHESEELVRQILNAGAQGYVLKSDAGRELITAVQALRQGVPFYTSRVTEIALRAYVSGERIGSHDVAVGSDSLSPREREVLQLLAEGKSNKEVADTCGISLQTAITHRAHVMQKLKLHSVAELVHYAVRNNIIAP